MKIRAVEPQDQAELMALIAGFRQSLARLRNRADRYDLESARRELAGYQEKDFPIFVAETEAGRLVGYLVCKVDDTVVWAESLYVDPAYRRGGVGSALYAKAEDVAAAFGNETLYNWVDPTNDRILAFLRKQGYQVLNLLEIRRAGPGERLRGKVRVGETEFDHA